MLRCSSCSASFFNVAGLIWALLPSWSVVPEPAIKSATGGRSTSGGIDSTASMAPTLILVSSAAALAAIPNRPAIASVRTTVPAYMRYSILRASSGSMIGMPSRIG